MADNVPVTKEAHEQNIREIQTYLREIAGSTEGVRMVKPDGVYGENTAGAVSDFQRISGMPETGETDRATWDAIYNYYIDVIENLSGQECIFAFPSVKTVIDTGDTGTSVIILQAMLNTIAGYFLNLDPVAVSGVYDSPTKKAVTDLQKAAGADVTGITDIRTWNLAVRVFNAAAAGEL